ncbi:MAG: MBL fold metallo-hydrolase, partial [Candidatus Diapherotrites archaeon]|nr:MBL fold metallo-hydrolase [Candidatus Diapherotrites archaeon]
LLPIGGKVTMDIIDAVKATKMIKPKIVIPMHYNTFEIIKANPKEFAERIAESALKTEVKILKPGQEIKL